MSRSEPAFCSRRHDSSCAARISKLPLPRRSLQASSSGRKCVARAGSTITTNRGQGSSGKSIVLVQQATHRRRSPSPTRRGQRQLVSCRGQAGPACLRRCSPPPPPPPWHRPRWSLARRTPPPPPPPPSPPLPRRLGCRQRTLGPPRRRQRRLDHVRRPSHPRRTPQLCPVRCRRRGHGNSIRSARQHHRRSVILGSICHSIPRIICYSTRHSTSRSIHSSIRNSIPRIIRPRIPRSIRKAALRGIRIRHNYGAGRR